MSAIVSRPYICAGITQEPTTFPLSLLDVICKVKCVNISLSFIGRRFSITASGSNISYVDTNPSFRPLSVSFISVMENGEKREAALIVLLGVMSVSITVLM